MRTSEDAFPIIIRGASDRRPPRPPPSRPARKQSRLRLDVGGRDEVGHEGGTQGERERGVETCASMLEDVIRLDTRVEPREREKGV